MPESQSPPLPRYRCHKIVNAVKIFSFRQEKDGSAVLDVGPEIPAISVSEAWMNRVPTDVLPDGGYFVRYEDGFTSWSPAAAFEAGYHLLSPAYFESPDPLLQFFTYTHLPAHLQHVSAPFCGLAHQIVSDLPRNPERTVALRKLLEAKDCAVRALIFT